MINNHMLRIGALFLLTVLSYGFYNAYLPITDPVESNYVLSAITMLKHNSWISPMIYDHVWYDKPPLTYWALMITYKLFGISDFTSRIPNTLVAGASVALMYHIIYRISKNTFASVLCAILLMSTLQFWYISHAIITDGFLFLFTLAIFGYSYLAFTNNDKSAMVKAYIAAALAVITKGPIGIILPGLILLIYVCARYIVHRKDEIYQVSKDIKLLFNPFGLLVFIAIASPWYIAMYSIHGEQFISGFLGLHNVDRALVSEHPKFDVWYYYLLIVPLSLLPWTPVIVYHLKDLNWKDDFDLLGIIWFIVIVLFYSLVATKYLTYTLPAIIPCIIWAAVKICELVTDKETGEFTQSFKKFNYLITLPLGIYYMIFTFTTAFDQSLDSKPLIVGSFIIVCIILIGRYYITSFFKLAIYALVPLITLYSAITITVPPILFNQSGLQFRTFIEDTSKPIYVYGSYYTSIVYYMDTTPTQVFVDTTDDSIWTEGKTLMPTITKETFLKDVSNNRGAYVIVPKKYDKDFFNALSYPEAKLVNKTKLASIYKLQSEPPVKRVVCSRAISP